VKGRSRIMRELWAHRQGRGHSKGKLLRHIGFGVTSDSLEDVGGRGGGDHRAAAAGASLHAVYL
jgi:hypothetical protein